MISILRHAFGLNENSDCLIETDALHIQVFDCYDCIPSQQRSYLKTKEEEPVHFTLQNPDTANLCFAALDNCIQLPHDPARCDFMIGNLQKLFFVEIKDTKTSQRHAARKNAIVQLESSLVYLKTKADLTNTELLAVTCFNGKQVYPLQNATRSAEIVRFKDRHNAQLGEGNSAVF